MPGSDSSYEYVVRYTAGADADERLPLVVALHGNGDSPANFFDTALDGLDEPARIVLLRAPRAMGLGGSAWPSHNADLRACGDGVAAVTRVLERQFPTTGAPIVVGFSGGAVVTYYLAAAHPDRFAFAMPIAGLLPEEALDRATSKPASEIVVRAFHGTRDAIVGIDAARHATEQLRSMWLDATLTELDGDHHAIFTNGKPTIQAALSDAVRTTAEARP